MITVIVIILILSKFRVLFIGLVAWRHNRQAPNFLVLPKALNLHRCRLASLLFCKKFCWISTALFCHIIYITSPVQLHKLRTSHYCSRFAQIRWTNEPRTSPLPWWSRDVQQTLLARRKGNVLPQKRHWRRDLGWESVRGIHGDYENLTGYARVCRPNFVPFVPYLINIFRGVSATYRAKVPRSFAYPFFCLTVQVWYFLARTSSTRTGSGEKNF